MGFAATSQNENNEDIGDHFKEAYFPWEKKEVEPIDPEQDFSYIDGEGDTSAADRNAGRTLPDRFSRF